MKETKTMEILKTAILLERKGKAFYSSVADKADDPDVKEFFENMADEEDDHIRFLTEQFAHYTKNKKFKETEIPKDDNAGKEAILSEQIKKKITAASFEAAAISAAIDFETRAVKVYSERAVSASDPEEKQFYQFLADWEKGHHKLLNEIDNELKEKVWFDNNFWPF
ncbi:MAG: ferritin family protein [Bacteroidota bacterium]|nr:ferritin family protein [Bacteroidota bacterium]